MGGDAPNARPTAEAALVTFGRQLGAVIAKQQVWELVRVLACGGQSHRSVAKVDHSKVDHLLSEPRVTRANEFLKSCSESFKRLQSPHGECARDVLAGCPPHTHTVDEVILLRHPVIPNLSVGFCLTNYEHACACGVGEVLVTAKGSHTAEHGLFGWFGQFSLSRIEIWIAYKKYGVEHPAIDSEVDVMRVGRDLDLAQVPPDIPPAAGAAPCRRRPVARPPLRRPCRNRRTAAPRLARLRSTESRRPTSAYACRHRQSMRKPFPEGDVPP